MISTSDLWATPDAAAYLNVTTHTLENWRYSKRVPIPFVKLGGAIRYRKSDLDAFIAKNLVEAGG